MEELLVGAKDAEEIRLIVDYSSFRELKRHWWKRNQIIEFEITDKFIKEFEHHVTLSGKYKSYILEDKDFKLFGNSTTQYFLVFYK